MGKTIIFISHRYINNYDFEISTTKSDRLVAIILDTCKHLFPEEKKKYFSKIYTIPQDDHSGPLIKFNYQNTKNVLLEELKNTDKSNLFLICIDEVNMILAGQLRDELELPGPKMQQLLKFQDKILMKEGLVNTDINLPVFTKFDPEIADANPETYFNQLQVSLGKKFILKPTRYTGSFGTALINTFENFMDFLHSKNHHKYEYEADQFIEGELYHCDIVLNKGKVIFSDCCKYSCPNLDFSFGKIIASLVLNPDSLIKQNLIETSLNSLSALGLISGTFHVELFVDPVGKIYFLEVAARPAGGLVAFMYEKLIGINLFTLDLLISLDRDIPPLEASKTHCLQALVPINTDTIEQLKKIVFQSELTIEWLIDADNIPKNTSKSVVDLAAKLLLTSNDYANIHSDFEKLSQCLPGKSQ